MSTGAAKLADIDVSYLSFRADFDAELTPSQPSRLEVVRTAQPGVPPPSSSLKFGHTFVSTVPAH